MTFKPNFRQWSGYLQARPGKFFHYWFVTSQRDPVKDPLLLWLNGGPGCSSLDGFLSENGPFHVNDDGATLYENTFSWNKIANVLYVESPAGVGYSYSDDKDYATDDNQVADDNYRALQSFFSKFPNFTQNEFFIFGESYGGIYAPTLSLRVATGKAKINLKGFAVGNGISSFALNDQSLIYFGYYHGLFGEDDAVGGNYTRLYPTVKDVYLKLLSLNLRVLVYNGDTDMACNFLGDKWFVEDLGLKPTTDYQSWIHDDQIAGFYEQYGNITFLTVKGAGHMVPQWAPGPALHMFQSFITNGSY
ncbi:Lysosomal protective protein [Collichthys lucidus]|uniref:Carboxypeptidase n=1 Tax=Collichthys lucidus TaxID=240159 RepID=A0A4U5U899_COLLU|nr:Lysosomal protective protein [Collichthys lucidus]